MEDLIIRPATNRDREQIRPLVISILSEYGLEPDFQISESDLGDIEAIYLRSGGTFDVVEDKRGNLLGTFGLYPIDEATCKLRKMYLVPQARGFGLGRRMVEHAIDLARGLGHSQVHGKKCATGSTECWSGGRATSITAASEKAIGQ